MRSKSVSDTILIADKFSSSRFWSELSFRQSEATRNLRMANLRFLFPPVIGMTNRELLKLDS
jgi:hypothetical protein